MQIADIINDGAQRELAFAAAVASGEKTDADLTENDYLIMPDGNMFANPKIAEVINENKGLELNSDDKDILTKAVKAYFTKEDGDASMAAAIDKGAENYSVSNIMAAKTLGDLLN